MSCLFGLLVSYAAYVILEEVLFGLFCWSTTTEISRNAIHLIIDVVNFFFLKHTEELRIFIL